MKIKIFPIQNLPPNFFPREKREFSGRFTDAALAYEETWLQDNWGYPQVLCNLSECIEILSIEEQDSCGVSLPRLLAGLQEFELFELLTPARNPDPWNPKLRARVHEASASMKSIVNAQMERAREESAKKERNN